MANEVYKQAVVLVAADSHPDSLTAFQNDSGPVVCNFHVLSLATDPSPGYPCSRRARTARPGTFALHLMRDIPGHTSGSGD